MSRADVLPVPNKVYWEEREDGLKPVMWNRKKEKYEDVVWTPQAGSQEAFLRSGYYEVLYSGTRGPGKTDALLMDFAQFVGRGFGGDWRGILFRRTYPELGDVIAKSRKWFPQIFPGAKYNASEHYWTFPDGETLLFRHFKTPDDYWNYHGHAYCVERTTPVLTPTGWTPIDQLRVGDYVETLNGPRRVNRVFSPRLTPCVRVFDPACPDVQQVQSEDHRLLSTSSDTSLSQCGSLQTLSRSSESPVEWRCYKQLRDEGQENRDGFSYVVEPVQEIDVRWSCSRFPVRLPLSLLKSVSQGRVEPHPRTAKHDLRLPTPFHSPSGLPAPFPSTRRERNQSTRQGRRRLSAQPQSRRDQPASLGGPACGFCGRGTQQGCSGHCLTGCGPCGEPLHLGAETVPVGFPPRGGVERHTRLNLLMDVSERTPSHTHPSQISFAHPYSGAFRRSDRLVGTREVELVPCGHHWTVDIEVEDGANYITKGGFIQRNCWIGWEELTSWPSPDCYTSMMSCARSANAAVPIRVRSTTNPYGCIPHGEVLTSSRGWVRIQDVQVGENVVSVNEAGEIVDSPVERVIEKHWQGEMVQLRSKGLRAEFTSDHRLPRLTPHLGSMCDHEVVPFDQLGEMDRIRRTGNMTPPDVGDDVAKFLGCVLVNGVVGTREGRECVQIPCRFSTVDRLLNHGGVRDRDGYHIDRPDLVELVRNLGPTHKRRIPEEYRRNPSVLLGLLAIGPVVYTDSDRLKDDILELATRCGVAVTSKYRSRMFEIFLNGASTYRFTEKNHVREDFEGTVYCLSVPETETFFVRQDGSVWLSGNSGHSWVKRRFRLPAAPGRMCTDLITDSVDKNGDIEPPRRAILGHIRENHVLLFADPGYIGRIKSSARNHAELEAWLNGSWDIVAGGMFDDVWDRNIHVLPNFPFHMIPRGWRIDRSYDHGQSRPFSVGWFAESNGEPIQFNHHVIGKVRGDIIRFAEWYGWNGEPNCGARMLTSEIAKGILERESQMGIYGRVKIGVADGSIFDQYEPGLSIVGEMRKNGVDWFPADKGHGSRKQGWQQIRERLEAAKPGPEGFREEPGLFVCEGCDNFLRTIPVLPRSDRDLDDVDTDAEDHIADELRYRVRFKTRQMRRGSWK